LGRTGGEPHLDLGVDRGAVGDPKVVGAKTRIATQFGGADRIDEALVGLFLARRQRDLSVFGAEHAVGRDDRMVVAGARRAGAAPPPAECIAELVVNSPVIHALTRFKR
jgi:hypothetical protein